MKSVKLNKKRPLLLFASNGPVWSSRRCVLPCIDSDGRTPAWWLFSSTLTSALVSSGFFPHNKTTRKKRLLCCGLFKPSRAPMRRVERNVRVTLTQSVRVFLDVDFCNGALSARVCALVVDPLAVPLHFGQVLVEDLAWSQRRHQVVELAPVVLSVCLRLTSLPLLLPLLPQLTTKHTTFIVFWGKKKKKTLWCELWCVYLSLHFGPALLLFLPLPDVLVFLLSLGERLQELVKDAEELVRLHLAGVFAKVLDCPQELRRAEWQREGRQDEIYSSTLRFLLRLIRSDFFEIRAGGGGGRMLWSSSKPRYDRLLTAQLWDWSLSPNESNVFVFTATLTRRRSEKKKWSENFLFFKCF